MINQTVKSNIPNLNIYASTDLVNTTSRVISKAHYHDEIELLIIYSGTLGVNVYGTDYYAESGSVVYIASRVPHSTFVGDTGVVYGLLQFKESDFVDPQTRKIIKYSIKLHSLSESPIKILKNKGLIEEFDAIRREQTERERAYDTMIRASTLRIIGILNREGALNINEDIYLSPTGRKILPALAYINERYKEDISLSEISARLGFNESYFCRIFKQATGATFTEYLNFVRVCKAEKMLTEGLYSILDISNKVGFTSVSYFNRIFKKYRNCSPGYYRAIKYCKNI